MVWYLAEHGKRWRHENFLNFKENFNFNVFKLLIKVFKRKHWLLINYVAHFLFDAFFISVIRTIQFILNGNDSFQKHIFFAKWVNFSKKKHIGGGRSFARLLTVTNKRHNDILNI